MGEDKIAAFYDDPVKQACDAWSAAKAYHFRSVSIDNGIDWRMQRWARFLNWLGSRPDAAGPATICEATFGDHSSSSSSSSSLSSSA